jgi:HD-GYP domain-containing protein (c-di-GMP phosphodiesterase class II)
MSVAAGMTIAGPDAFSTPAELSPQRQARTSPADLLAEAPARRDSDWSAPARTHEGDLGWAAKRAAVTIAAAMLHACHGGTGSHCDDVVHLCDRIADELGVYGNDRAELLGAAQLHDIGKVAIAPGLLNKPGPLDDHEWRLMQEHTVVGERIIRSIVQLDEVGRLVRHSHERWDGAGYPDGLSGDQIPLASRIIFCADAFHAIRSDRPYRRGRTAQFALEEIARAEGSQFDPEIVDALIKTAERLRTSVQAGADGLTTTLRSRRLVELLT